MTKRTRIADLDDAAKREHLRARWRAKAARRKIRKQQDSLAAAALHKRDPRKPFTWSDIAERRIAGMIAAGYGLDDIAKLPGFPTAAEIARAATDQQRHSRFADRYRRARKARAEVMLDRAEMRLRDAPPADAAGARAAAELAKWRAAKDSPERYADKPPVNTAQSTLPPATTDAPGWLLQLVAVQIRALPKGNKAETITLDNDQTCLSNQVSAVKDD